jgi:hypothetical protein
MEQKSVAMIPAIRWSEASHEQRQRVMKRSQADLDGVRCCRSSYSRHDPQADRDLARVSPATTPLLVARDI